MADASLLSGDALELERNWTLPDRGKVGVVFLILTETALFTIFVVAYLVYHGHNVSGPSPDVLAKPIFSSICLLSSSLTIVLAEKALHRGRLGTFRLWWAVTILLGLEFLGATAIEWRHLIYNEHLTMSTNLFGTTYYALVGLHASHVIAGMFFLLLVMAVTFAGFPIKREERRVMFLSWYWHFVDAVWVVVFTVVYLLA